MAVEYASSQIFRIGLSGVENGRATLPIGTVALAFAGRLA